MSQPLGIFDAKTLLAFDLTKLHLIAFILKETLSQFSLKHCCRLENSGLFFQCATLLQGCALIRVLFIHALC